MAEGPDFYDAAIADDAERPSPHLHHPLDSPYRTLYETVAAMLTSRPPAHLVDLGCGTGRFASLVLPHTGATLSYVGADFSAGMIDEARRYNADHLTGEDSIDVSDLDGTVAFVQRNLATDLDGLLLPWIQPLTIVCLETLEHLDNDLRLLARLPLEARLIVSVPSFDSAAHVRHFPAAGDAIDRYDQVLDIESWKPIWLPSRTGYFHLLSGKVRP